MGLLDFINEPINEFGNELTSIISLIQDLKPILSLT